jgi:hypothetical protein
MESINVAYQGGSHGSFLRHFLDKFSSLTTKILENPFTKNGTVHKQTKNSEKIKQYHLSKEYPYFQNVDETHILITVENNDLLFLQRIAQTRAGDNKIDLTKDFVKFTKSYITGFNIEKEFYTLYNKNVDEKTGIPKYIFRDYLKLSFLDTSTNGFIKSQKNCLRTLPKKTLFFPVNAFWNKDIFFKEIKILNEKLDLKLILEEEAKEFFITFLNNIKELPTRDRVREAIDCLKNKKDYDLSKIDVVEQAYLSSYIEQNYRFINIPNTNYFFQNTKEILDWIDWYPEYYKAMNPNLPTFNGIPNPFYLHKNGK